MMERSKFEDAEDAPWAEGNGRFVQGTGETSVVRGVCRYLYRVRGSLQQSSDSEMAAFQGTFRGAWAYDKQSCPGSFSTCFPYCGFWNAQTNM
jgi:hypothetical protein